EQPTPWKAAEREPHAGGHADQQRHQRRRARDHQRQPEDGPNLGIAGDQQSERLAKALDEKIHQQRAVTAAFNSSTPLKLTNHRSLTRPVGTSAAVPFGGPL